MIDQIHRTVRQHQNQQAGFQIAVLSNDESEGHAQATVAGRSQPITKIQSTAENAGWSEDPALLLSCSQFGQDVFSVRDSPWRS